VEVARSRRKKSLWTSKNGDDRRPAARRGLPPVAARITPAPTTPEAVAYRLPNRSRGTPGLGRARGARQRLACDPPCGETSQTVVESLIALAWRSSGVFSAVRLASPIRRPRPPPPPPTPTNPPTQPTPPPPPPPPPTTPPPPHQQAGRSRGPTTETGSRSGARPRSRTCPRVQSDERVLETAVDGLKKAARENPSCFL